MNFFMSWGIGVVSARLTWVLSTRRPFSSDATKSLNMSGATPAPSSAATAAYRSLGVVFFGWQNNSGSA